MSQAKQFWSYERRRNTVKYIDIKLKSNKETLYFKFKQLQNQK